MPSFKKRFLFNIRDGLTVGLNRTLHNCYRRRASLKSCKGILCLADLKTPLI